MTTVFNFQGQKYTMAVDPQQLVSRFGQEGAQETQVVFGQGQDSSTREGIAQTSSGELQIGQRTDSDHFTLTLSPLENGEYEITNAQFADTFAPPNGDTSDQSYDAITPELLQGTMRELQYDLLTGNLEKLNQPAE